MKELSRVPHFWRMLAGKFRVGKQHKFIKHLSPTRARYILGQMTTLYCKNQGGRYCSNAWYIQDKIST